MSDHDISPHSDHCTECALPAGSPEPCVPSTDDAWGEGTTGCDSCKSWTDQGDVGWCAVERRLTRPGHICVFWKAATNV